ncbi:hypothetical protein D187_005716 [Cystobacter fuscus DSM 2262]|uniref:Uncharacterized protein n=2 Tax=Cystobacter fuscus TaxID=43 RepID=S9PFZ8_CYSF2|nr:hypothetical protein D187_005716 [Cystobacter fuscus DSM 2262]
MHKCWETKRSENIEASVNVSSDIQADGVFKKLISGQASLAGGSEFKKQMQAEFSPLASDTVAAAKIEACYRMASGGDSLHLSPAPDSKPTSRKPKKVSFSPPGSSPPPDWTCHEPAVFLSARCDKGGLDGSTGANNVSENEGVVHGWQKKEQVYSTSCKHTTPSEGSIKTRSSCEAKDGAVRLKLVNRVEGKGGYSDRKDCSRRENCLTYLAFRIDEGGAAVRIPQDAAGRYDLQVDSFDCTDKPSMGPEKVHLEAMFLGRQIPFEVGKRFPLTEPGLVEVRLRGNLKFEVDHAKEAFAGDTGCTVDLSLQPH